MTEGRPLPPPPPLPATRDDDPGVPEARGRALDALLEAVPAARIDGLWSFPPIRKGRKESGLLAAGLFLEEAPGTAGGGEGGPEEGGAGPEVQGAAPPVPPEPVAPPPPTRPTAPATRPAPSHRRILVTLAWRAEETGKGIAFETRFQEEGEAPEDRLPRVMTGVIRRMDEAAGEPRYLSVAGDPALLQALRDQWTRDPGP